MVSLVNITISVPNGTVTHDDGHVLCVYGSSWRASLYIATFFAANYAAHAATIKSNPGDKTPVTVCNIILALLFPVSGLMRAVNAIVRFGRRGGSDVEKACRAGALCMVVRIPGWLPAVGQTLDATLIRQTWTKSRRDQDEEGAQLDDLSPAASHRGFAADVKVYRPNFAAEESSKWLYSDAVGGRANVSLAATKVHGSYILPQGYGFAILPRDTRLLEWTNTSTYLFRTNTFTGWTDGNDIASTYSLAKAAISIIQALAAFATLLGHREDVVRRWGYASFHLTILPYLVMTVFNFVSNICTADYDCLYMVETLVMDEARERGGMFEGTVAATYTVIGPASEDKVPPNAAELDNYNGFDGNKTRALGSRLAIIEEKIVSIVTMVPILPLVLIISLPMAICGLTRNVWKDEVLYLKRLLWSKPWSKESTKPIEISCSRVVPAAHAPEALIPAEPHLRPHGSGTEQLDAGSNHPSSIGEGVRPISFGRSVMLHGLRQRRQILEDTMRPFHTCDPGGSPSPGFRRRTASITYVLTDDRKLSISYPSTLEEYKSPQLYVRDLKTAAKYLSKLKNLENDLQVDYGADQGPLAKFRGDTMLWFTWYHFLFLFGIGITSPVSKVPCAACDQKQSSVLKKVIVYFPTCHPFLRGHDASVRTHRLRESTSTINLGGSRCGTAECYMPVQKRRHAFGGIIAQLIVGLVVNGIILTLIGSQSEWFAAGQASQKQKVILLLWMCEGTLGMFFVILSFEEVMLAFFLFPWYMLKAGRTYSAAVVFVVPLTIFVAPVWGFVIVGQMLVDWGQCVTLYH